MKAPPFMKTHKLAKRIIFSKKEGNKIKVGSFDFLTMATHLDLC